MKNNPHILIAIMLFFYTAAFSQQKQSNMETQATIRETRKPIKAISKDLTAIAYEKTGTGPVLIVVNGALSQRNYPGSEKLVSLLANDFTVVLYDRRGRGESNDTEPYAVHREVEDIEAIIDEVGGKAYLFGSSSGAALALLAAEKLGPEKVMKLALYEPPYEAATNEEYAKEKHKVNELVKEGRSAEAVSYFMERRGVPSDKMEEMKRSPEWKGMVSIGHTLVYDFQVMEDGTIPIAVAKNVQVPTLVIDGEKSFDFVHTTADKVGKTIPNATRKTLSGQTHNASPETLAPVLIEFF